MFASMFHHYFQNLWRNVFKFSFNLDTFSISAFYLRLRAYSVIGILAHYDEEREFPHQLAKQFGRTLHSFISILADASEQKSVRAFLVTFRPSLGHFTPHYLQSRKTAAARCFSLISRQTADWQAIF